MHILPDVPLHLYKWDGTVHTNIFNAILLNGGTTTDLTILNIHSWGTFFSSPLTQCHRHQPDASIFGACGNTSSGSVRSKDTHAGWHSSLWHAGSIVAACGIFLFLVVAGGISSFRIQRFTKAFLKNYWVLSAFYIFATSNSHFGLHFSYIYCSPIFPFSRKPLLSFFSPQSFFPPAICVGTSF